MSLLDNNQQTALLREAQQPGYRDAFGRQRVSNPFTLFDSKLILDSAPNFWDDQQTSGSGTTSTFDRTNAKVVLGVTASTAGTRTRQTIRRFNYQPGKSQQILMTFVFGAAATGITRRAGYYGSYNGVYLEQTSTGARFCVQKGGVVAETFEQANWNTDTLNGLGPSGINLDLTKCQIMFIDFEWLGVGSVRMGFVINAQFVVAHVAHHANSTFTDVYMSSPNHPLRYELINDGTGGAAYLSCICSSVVAEGGAERVGLPRAIDRGSTGLTTLNDADTYPVLGLRVSASGSNVSLNPTAASMTCTSSAIMRYSILLNPLFVGTSPTWTPLANSAAEYANGTTSATKVIANTGTLVGSQYADTAVPALTVDFPNYFALGQKISGVSDELWLCAARLTGTTETVYGSLNFDEQ